MKVFVAGATGAIGRPLVKKLVADRHEVTALVRKKDDGQWMDEVGAKAEIGDALDADFIRNLLLGTEPDVVINELRVMPKRYNPQSMRAAEEPDRKVREFGGGNLETVTRDLGVKRYILQSSAFWYAQGEGLADEQTDFAFEAPARIGDGCRFFQKMEQRAFSTLGPAVVIVRYGFFYGPRTYNAQDGDVSEQVRNRQYPLVGDGRAVWSWVHIEDAARATSALVGHGAAGIYNVVDDNPIRVSDWLPAYAKCMGAPPPPRVPVDQIKDEGLVYYETQLRGASNARIKREIDFQPRRLEWLQASEQRERLAS